MLFNHCPKSNPAYGLPTGLSSLAPLKEFWLLSNIAATKRHKNHSDFTASASDFTKAPTLATSSGDRPCVAI